MRPDLGDDDLWGVLLRAQELPEYIAHGVLDCGLTGYDWILERNVDVVEVCDLLYAKGGMRPYRWVLAVHENSGIERWEDLQGKRIATELVDVTRRFLAEHGVEAEVEFSWGATEAKCPDLVDAVVEGTETGSTLRANNLRIIETLFDLLHEVRGEQGGLGRSVEAREDREHRADAQRGARGGEQGRV
jgi:ATP phosphoribosyltransferase